MKNSKLSADIEALAHKVIGCAIEVHRELGPGFLEAVYEEALCIELKSQKIAFKQQHEIGVSYKGHVVGKGRIDVLIEDKIVVELKTIERFEPVPFSASDIVFKGYTMPIRIANKFQCSRFETRS